MKPALGLLLMILAMLSGAAALLCIAIAVIFSDIRTLGAGTGVTSDAVAIIAGLVLAALLLWWGGRALRRSVQASGRTLER
jgi:hypothetical protein